MGGLLFPFLFFLLHHKFYSKGLCCFEQSTPAVKHILDNVSMCLVMACDTNEKNKSGKSFRSYLV